jgi:hypothetical protein
MTIPNQVSKVSIIKGLGEAILKHLMEYIKTYTRQDGIGTYI